MAEVMQATPGEIMDFAACDAIAHGAKPKMQRTFDEVMKIR